MSVFSVIWSVPWLDTIQVDGRYRDLFTSKLDDEITDLFVNNRFKLRFYWRSFFRWMEQGLIFEMSIPDLNLKGDGLLIYLSATRSQDQGELDNFNPIRSQWTEKRNKFGEKQMKWSLKDFLSIRVLLLFIPCQIGNNWQSITIDSLFSQFVNMIGPVPVCLTLEWLCNFANTQWAKVLFVHVVHC